MPTVVYNYPHHGRRRRCHRRFFCTDKRPLRILAVGKRKERKDGKEKKKLGDLRKV